MKDMQFGRQMFESSLLGLVGWALICGAPAFAVTITNVSVGDDFFNPPNVTIAVNDKVRWMWVGLNQHSSTSDTGLWDSGLQNPGFRFTNTFSMAGSFPYHCTVPTHVGQVGNITVQSAKPPPILLSNPQRLSATQFRFDYTASAGQQYVVQRSTSFTNFIALATNTAAGSSV